jgi:hypothetical protein
VAISCSQTPFIPSIQLSFIKAPAGITQLTIYLDKKFMPHATADMGEATINGDMPESSTLNVST